MLRELRIRNFAVIDELTVEFGPGLNVLSGETGTGKSVIVTALELVLGGRSAAGYLRSGAREMSVQAVFSINPAQFKAKLEKYGLEAEDVLILRRRLGASGKSYCYANDVSISLAALADMGQELVDIHGQHQHQLLLRAENHLSFLDDFAGTSAKARQLERLFADWRELRDRQRRLQEQRREDELHQELMQFQAREIDEAALEEGEEERLLAERNLLLNAGKILESGHWAHRALYAGEGSASELLARARERLRGLGRFAGELAELERILESLGYQLQDAASSLANYLETVEYDPARHRQIEDRLALLSALKKKYGASVGEILEFRRKLAARLEGAGNSDEKLRQLTARAADLQRQLVDLAADLSCHRRRAREKLEKCMSDELAQLGMPQAVFQVCLRPLAGPRAGGDDGYSGTERGLEEAEFLFSANPGQSPRPLRRVASGGELSRIMLALKGLLAGADRVGTLVFDEVDAGIGGRAAEIVGRKLRRQAAFQQVICITHLPQIAALAQHHYTVSKRIEQGRTFTAIARLGSAERVREIARMLAGARITPAALAHAEQMIAEGRKAAVR